MLRTFLSIFESGAWILWPIFFTSAAAWYVGVVKYLHVRRVMGARRRFLALLESPSAAVRSTGMEAYDELLHVARVEQGETRAQAARQFLAGVVPELERGFSTIAACAAAAPLMGLLGTIVGMNRMFTVINEFGYGSPLLMAGAISIALQASLTGLTVAVAAMFLHNYLYNKTSACTRALRRDCGRLTGTSAQPGSGTAEGGGHA